jgi:large subunit ribosomal protein L9
MKVLLIKDVQGLGKEGEVKEVKPGYGQNFLIGKGMAKNATSEVLAQYEKDKADKEQQDALEIKELTQEKNTIEEITIKLHKPLGNNGHLFGAITKDEIAKELSKHLKIEVDKKTIHSDGNIKTVGLHEVDLKLGHGIHAKLKVEVIGDN